MRTGFATAVALLLVVAPLRAQESSLNDFLEVAGHVRASASNPVENALVIAFSLSDTLNLKASSGRDGEFALPPLPIGVYRIVAVKRGFLPAFVTVLPTKKYHRLVLQLENQATATESQKVDAWTIRRSLPKDVLREVDMVLGNAPRDFSSESRIARFAGNMESVAGYSGATANRELESTSVAFRTDVGEWGLEFQGRRQLIEQPDVSTGAAEAADVALEVRSSPTNAYSMASTRATWRPWANEGGDAGVQTHSIAWHGRMSSIQVRYLSQENLFSSQGAGDEDSLELAGNATVYRGQRGDFGVSLRLRQNNMIGDSTVGGIRDRYADLATTGRYVVMDGLGLECGVVTRIGENTLQFMPQTAAEIGLGDALSLQLAGAYKFDATPDSLHPAPGIAYLGQYPTNDTRYKYSVTVSSDLGENAGVSATARRAAADALTFLLFDDRFDEFWDGLYLHEGEVLSDGILSVRAGLGSSFQIALVTSAGRVEPLTGDSEGKRYFSGEVRTHYEPTGTSLDVSYRVLDQPDLVDESVLREIERMSIVIGQSLHLPVDLRLLVGFSVANEGETIASVSENARSQKRVMGGLSFSF